MTSRARLGSGPHAVRACLDSIKGFCRPLRTCLERPDEHVGMADFLVVLGIVLFAVAFLALIKGLEKV
jgi:hypothetical protein